MNGQHVDVKVVMVGKDYVGKMSLMERYGYDRFLMGPYHNTIGAAFVSKGMSGSRTVTLGLWDTADSKRYEAMSRVCYHGAKVADVCSDLTDSSSFKRAKFLVNELQTLEGSCQIYLCGIKSDLLEEDQRLCWVDCHDIQDSADDIKAQFFETSSKTSQSVDELFQKMAEDNRTVAALQLMAEDKGIALGQKGTTLSSYYQH